ncbi:MAG: alkaline phosphatase family protein [Pseudomonadota bacterium]|nr:alkaline phosphatase family protein [Pseudomonadota bacterium]
MPVPDFQGGSIVNLMSSIIRARGGESDYPPLRLLPPEEIAGVTNIVLVVLDGLGADWLARESPDGVLSRNLKGTITSVFPPTTASAITSFLTGDAPQQHAITGWHTYLRELGCVMTVLPGTPRYGGVGYRKAQIDPVRLFGHRSVFDRIATRSIVVSPTHIARSDFNLAHLGRAKLLSFETLPEMFHKTTRALRSGPEPKYLYLYWPELDSIGHEQGIGSTAAGTHFREIESALTDFMVSAAGTDTLLLITADHGQIDTGDADRIDLADHPELAKCLTLPLCGESRAAFCYLRPNRVDTFEAYCCDQLSHALETWPSRELVERGLFGLGRPNLRLGERIGDFVLLMKGNHVIREWLPFEKPYKLVGVHGGLSEAELKVPLCVFRT